MTKTAKIHPAQAHTPPSGDPEYPHRYTGTFARAVENKWQQQWEAKEVFKAANPGEAGFDSSKPKFYCLDMFPYPSGAGLHVGHPVGYIATDIVCRYRRHRGFNVLHPMGWDAFGLPAEQYAIQTNIHPAVTTRNAIDTFRRQMKQFGLSYDWSREFATIDPDYYKWTQWIWLKAYKAWYDTQQDRARPINDLVREFKSGNDPVDALNGQAWKDLSSDEQRRIVDNQRLAYLAEQTVNWCPKLGTALANEEVIDGKSERGGFPVFRRPLKQWMFRITAYAERLLRDLDQVTWPESTRTMQAEWIGRSEGAEIDFPISNLKTEISINNAIRVFTTRPDTVFGATFMVLAPEHPLIEEIIQDPQPETDVAKIRAYVETAKKRSDVDRMADTKDKTGVFTGAYAVNPANKKKIPIWIADYVLIGYGHGAIMAVPAHDGRDHAFARKYDLPITQVVTCTESVDFRDEAWVGEGPLMHSGDFNGVHSSKARRKITEWLETHGLGKPQVNYKLRDWLISRQRYWGEPFPVVFDSEGRHYPVDENNLPVLLPEMEDYKPIESDEPVPLLAKATSWLNTSAKEAGVSPELLPGNTQVKRETNTMPGWAGSCWYYLRFCDPTNATRFVSAEAEKYWMRGGGVDLYIGGAEHAVLHLLYARFWHKILYDLGEVSTPEPFSKLFHQGLITAFAYQRDDKSLVPSDGVEERAKGEFIEKTTGKGVSQVIAKMSKSLRNVVNPDDVIAEYGADTFRVYEMVMGPLEQSKPWNPRDIEGPFRFLARVWRLAVDELTGKLRTTDHVDETVEKLLHRTIAKVGHDIDRLSFNTAVATLIEFVNAAMKSNSLTHDQLERFSVALSPFAPHVAEELWSRLGHNETIVFANWPDVDESMLQDDVIELPVQVMGKLRGHITVPTDADSKTVEEAALNDERISQVLEGKTVRKVVVVPGKIVNIVAN